VHHCCAQSNLSLGQIDDWVQSIEPAGAADLAQTLTSPFPTGIQKVRAIYSWIAQHIEYRTKRTGHKDPAFVRLRILKPIDSVEVNSADDFVAEMVLRNLSGVCEGYARLFKTLCSYAGIHCVLITGYARSDMERVGTKFFSNHYWNAVLIDSAWHLIDVTWSSGYFTYYGSEFIKHFDDYYFFTPPDLFIRDHFPDDLQWTLLPDPPAPEEFRHSPFRQRSFVKYNLYSLTPSTGMIIASLGDTLHLEWQTSDAEADKRKAQDTASLDSGMLAAYSSVVFLQPVFSGRRIRYSYVISSPDVRWLHLMYNNDVIVRYRLNIKKEKAVHH
jgi:hypothetical protein